MRPRAKPVLASLALLAFPLDLIAQDAFALSPKFPLVTVGSRVRLAAPALLEGSFAGRVVAMDEQTLTVEVDDRIALVVPRDAIARLDVSLRRKNNLWRGLAIGVVAGALLIGVSADVDPYDCSYASPSFCSRREAVAAGALVGGLVGFGVGRAIKSDRWTGVPLDGWRPGARPERGAGFEISLRF